MAEGGRRRRGCRTPSASTGESRLAFFFLVPRHHRNCRFEDEDENGSPRLRIRANHLHYQTVHTALHHGNNHIEG
jgi:hypothetical protein